MNSKLLDGLPILATSLVLSVCVSVLVLFIAYLWLKKSLGSVGASLLGLKGGLAKTTKGAMRSMAKDIINYYKMQNIAIFAGAELFPELETYLINHPEAVIGLINMIQSKGKQKIGEPLNIQGILEPLKKIGEQLNIG